VKLKDISRYTLRAIALTHDRVDHSNLVAPTWDGTTLHIGRLKNEEHVLHEVAHWIVAPPARRTMPNYGLGRDPDGGPLTLPYPLATLEEASSLLTEVGLSTEGLPKLLIGGLKSPAIEFLHELSDARTEHEESLASIVTVILMRCAGMAWASEMRRVFGKLATRPDGFGMTTFWEGCVELAGERGVNLMNPLEPFRLTLPIAKELEGNG
jgi:hypothetical protein